jgi:hypothetical protein
LKKLNEKFDVLAAKLDSMNDAWEDKKQRLLQYVQVIFKTAWNHFCAMWRRSTKMVLVRFENNLQNIFWDYLIVFNPNKISYLYSFFFLLT